MRTALVVSLVFLLIPRIDWGVRADALQGVPALQVTEQPLAKLDSTVVGGSLVISPDGMHVAYVARRGDKACVVLDGAEQKLYDRIWERSLAFSPDGLRLAYVAGRGDGFFALSHEDNSLWAYMAQYGSRVLLVVDGREGNEYAGIGAGQFFSQDGKRVAYWAARLRSVGSPLGSTPGALGMIWPASVITVVVDGAETAELPWDDPVAPPIPAGSPLLSPDGRRVAYVVRRGAKSFVVVDGVEGRAYDRVDALAFSDDSAHVSYRALAGRSMAMVIDAVDGKDYDGIGSDGASFSRDGKRVSFTAKRGAACFQVTDGTEGAAYEMVAGFTFSPDGKRTAYVARRGGRSCLLLDERAGQEYDSVGVPVFSPNGSGLAFIATRGSQQFAVVNGAEGRPYAAAVGVAFSPDSKHTAYVAVRDGKPLIVLGAEEVQGYDALLTHFTFGTTGVLCGVARRGRDVVRVEIRSAGE